MTRRRRILAGVVFASLAATLGAAGVSVLRPMDDASAFAQDASPLRDAAAQLGWRAQRMEARPAALVNDPLLAARSTVLAVVGPQDPYSPADRAAVGSFVRAGGLLLVADDGGQANTLLSEFRLATERVRLVETTDAWHWGVPEGALAPTLPSPTAVLVAPGTDVAVIAASSGNSYLDRDGAGLVDAGDAVGPFPVAVRIGVGEGAVVVVADAQALSGPAAVDNTEWLAALLATERPDGALLLADESWMRQDAPMASLAALRTAAADGAFRWGLAGVAAIALLLLLARHAGGEIAPHRFRPLRFLRRQGWAAPPASSSGTQWSRRAAAVFAAAPALALAWALWGSSEAALGAGLMFAGLGASLLVRLPRVAADRVLAQGQTTEGSSVQVDVVLRRPVAAAVDLHDDLGADIDLQGQSSTALRAGAAGRVLSYAAAPAVRGPQPIGPLWGRRTDPLGLRRIEAIILGPDVLHVLPRSTPMRRAPFAARSPAVTMGPHRVNRAGDGTEFQALRPYLAGDPFRSVNWKASARTKDLMVNQRVHESRTCLTLVLDARAVAGAGPAARTPLARSCRAALSIATGAVRMRDRVRVAVYGAGVDIMPPRPAARLVHELSELLARLPAAGATPLREAIERLTPELRAGNPVVVVSAFEEDLDAPEALVQLRARGVPVWVLSPPPLVRPLDAEDGGPEPGADRIEAERSDVLGRLRAAGVPVLEAATDIPLDDLLRAGGAS